MIPAIQKQAIALGESGCYFFSLAYLAEKVSQGKIDVFEAFDRARALRYVRPDCFIYEAGKLLTFLSGKEWTFSHEAADYHAKDGELEILRFEWTNKPGVTLGHFVVGDGLGHVEYDPMSEAGLSPVVKNGKRVSKRIFRRKT